MLVNFGHIRQYLVVPRSFCELTIIKISHLILPFSPSKSLLSPNLNLFLGEKGKRQTVRSGSKRFSIVGSFRCSSSHTLKIFGTPLPERSPILMRLNIFIKVLFLGSDFLPCFICYILVSRTVSSTTLASLMLLASTWTIGVFRLHQIIIQTHQLLLHQCIRRQTIDVHPFQLRLVYWNQVICCFAI